MEESERIEGDGAAPVIRALPAESEENNIEYKLWVRRDRKRIEGLKSQMNVRLLAGDGTATYWVGVMDDGTQVGIAPDSLDESIAVLRLVASEVGAKIDQVDRAAIEGAPCKMHYRLDAVVPKQGCREVARLRISRTGCEMPPIFI